MGRAPMTRDQLDIRSTFEIPHHSSTDDKPTVYRYVVGIFTTDGQRMYGCVYGDCPNAYAQRESARRHLRINHKKGADNATARATTVVSLDYPPAPPEPAAEAPTEAQTEQMEAEARADAAEAVDDVLAGIAESPGADVSGDALVDGLTRLIKERDEWRDRALSAESRLRNAAHALIEP